MECCLLFALVHHVGRVELKCLSSVMPLIFLFWSNTSSSSNFSAVSTLEKTVIQLTKRLESLECGSKTTVSATTTTPAPAKAKEEEEDDDEVDLFGSDDEEVCYACLVLMGFVFCLFVM